MTWPPPARQHLRDAFREGLRGLGYVGGQTVLLEVHWSSGEAGQYSEPLASLIRIPVDVIAVQTTSRAIAAKRATTTIPIVAASAGSPVESGAGGESRAARRERHEAHNSAQSVEFLAKRVELLKEVIPRPSCVAAIQGATTNNPESRLFARQTETGAWALKVQFQYVHFSTSR